MSKSWKSLLAAVGGLCLVTAVAVTCPDDKSHDHKGATTVAKTEDGRSETTPTSKPCCDKPCGRPECPHGKAALTADKSAGETKGGHSGCSHAKSATVAKSSADEGGCSIGKKVEAVLASLPHMKYRVGSETTDCPHAAGDLAKKNGGKMEYVVGEQTFSSKGEAFGKLASMLEEKAVEMADVQYSVGGDCMRCPQSAKQAAAEKKTQIAYRVGGVDFAEQEKAQKTAQLVKDAVASLKTTYRVGDESFCCDKMAGMKAKETGKPITYMVGDQACADADELQYKTAETKIRKIVETAAGQLGS